MENKIRIPLPTSIESRDATLNKDMLVSNVFVEETADGATLVKRPGLDTRISALGSGVSGALDVGLGIFVYEGKIYSFNTLQLFNPFQTIALNTSKVICFLYNKVFYFDSTGKLQFDTVVEGTEKVIDTSAIQYNAVLWDATNSKFYKIGRSQTSTFIPNINTLYCMESTDGITWTQTGSLAGCTSNFPVAGGNTTSSGLFIKHGTRLIYVTADGQYSYVSTNSGVTWTENATGITSYSFDNNLFYGATNGTTLTLGDYYTSDGITWNACTGSPLSAPGQREIVWTGSRFITFYGDAQQISYSSNGISWTTSSVSASLSHVATSGSVTIATGLSGVYTVGIPPTITKISDDGYVKGAYRSFYFNSTFYTVSKFVGVDETFYTLNYSTNNGVTWETTFLDIAIMDSNPTIISGVL